MKAVPHLSFSSATFSLTLSGLMLIGSLFCILMNQSFILEFELLMTSATTFSFPFICDFMSLSFFSFVSLISSAVILYTKDYMKDDPFFTRFLFLMLMFISSMFFLIFSLNMIAIMLGWDGLGLTSYILVIYYQNEKSNAAGMITALSNRIGDAALLLAMGLLITNGSWNFLWTSVSFIPSLVTMLVILAAMTKSAQMPFSAWLPAAMAAPTPVSALVHSSTLVTAGVYILIRFSPSILLSPFPSFIFPIAILTTLMASIAACFELDLKKIVALSTLSQLGLMMMTLSFGFPLLTFFHLLTHATFKALLFLASGKIIHESSSSQDIRAMGSIMQSLPLTSVGLNTANFALCGIPFLAGFYSKDLIMESTFMTYPPMLTWSLLCTTVGLTASYSLRMTFAGLQNFNQQNTLSSSEEKTPQTSQAIMSLGGASIISGAMLSWLMFPNPNPIILTTFMKFSTPFSIFVGGTIGMILSINTSSRILPYSHLIECLSLMWFLSPLSGGLTSKSSLLFSTKIKTLEMGWLEHWGGQGLYSSLSNYSSTITKSQTQPLSLFLILFGTVMLLSLIS